MKKRFFSIITALALCLSLLPTAALAVSGPVNYLNDQGIETTYTGEYTELTNENPGGTSWGDGWYVVTGDVIIGSRVTVSGDVRLILTDGCTLTVNGGIQVQDDDDDITNGSANALTIYAQSTDESTMGKLIAKGAEYDDNAAIGGYGDTHISVGGSGGEVTITGGTVTATGNASGNTSVYIIGVEGIGGGRYDITSGTDGTFQTTNNGNAVIFASSIGDQSGKTSNAWHGIIFEGDEGKVYGNPTLAAELTIPENKALDIPVGKTLTVNSTITVKGILTNDGTIIGSGSITPDEKKLTYKAAPSTPVIDSVSADSITLQPIVGETAVEYSKDNTNWQSGTTFSGLTAATSYTFYARYQENGFYKGASPQSGGNAPAYTAYAAPVTNEGYSIDYAAETITVSDGYEVNTDSGFGTGTVVTSGSTVTPGQTFHVRKAANGSIPASEGTEFTIPARPAAPAAPTVKSKTYSSVTLEVILGAQYSMDGGATWQDSPEFTGLSASTAYRFVARYGATESRFASLASAELNVTTSTTPSSGGSSTPTYPPSVTQPENGTVTVSPKAPKKGDTVTITPKPEDGYTVEQILVTDKNGDPVEVINNGDGTYSFTQPAGKVNINVTFMEDNSMLNFFVDVFPGDYYYDAVLWAAENGITGGVDDTRFAPNAPCTRAQIVTFLWRAAGSPVVNYAMNFSDVPADAYYAEAVRWAVSQGITKGTSDTTFGPDATCTRAQAMTFIYRSEQAQGGGMQGTWMFLNPFSDVDLENYYGEAVMWAVANGVTNGTSDTTFSPGADCTRAQIVTFLYRFFVK